MTKKIKINEYLEGEYYNPYCETCGTCGYIGCCGIRNFIDEHIKGKTNCKNEDIIINELIDLCEYKDEVFEENKKLKEQKKQAIENIKTIKHHYEELRKAPFEDSVFINDMLRQSFILSIESYLDLFLEILGDKE